MKTKREQLKRISEIVTDKVCNVTQFVTKAEADLLEKLEKEVGEQWDAVNNKWIPLDND